MTKTHRFLLTTSIFIIISELGVLIYYYSTALDWLSHNLWVVVIPFTKLIFKKVIALKFIVFFKVLGSLVFNLFKLLLLKILKTLTVRYGVFFSQRQWRWMRWCKVMFLRKGKILFRSLKHFWVAYNKRQQYLVWIAFFPLVLLLFFMGISFNVTRKTMVQKTQETAVFKTAITASNGSRGVRAWIAGLDRKVLEKIKILTRR